MSDELRIDRDDRGVVTLTMDRPDVRNAFGPDLIGALADALADLAADDTVRVLVLTGAGTVFSAGADLNWMRSMVDYSQEEQVADSRQLDGLMHALDTFPAPVVARVNGHAIAGATGLVAASDIVVAVAPAKFGFTEARLGLVPAVISTYVLPRIGTAAARRWFLSGELFDAAEAQRIGLIHQVCDPDDLDTAVAGVVDGLLAAAPGAQRMIKRMIRDVATMDRDTARERMVALIAEARNGPEGQAGMQAFLDGGDPPWRQG
jgi:methylglutaconyl-CoA hydratase